MSASSKKALVFALSLGLALGAAACAGPAGRVSVLQSASTPLVPGSTYAWAPIAANARSIADPRIANDIIQERLRLAVDTALNARGFRQVSDPSAASLLVAYHVGLENRTETRVNTTGWGWGPPCRFRGCVGGWGLYGPPRIDVDNITYVQGTLILDLIDRASGRLAWRSTSERRVDQGDASQESLNAILMDMTRNLPGA